MINFSAHLGYQFNEVPFRERFSLARKSGYRHVEFPDPYCLSKEEIYDLLTENELGLVQFATPLGETGGKGFAALPGRDNAFRESINTAVIYAKHLNCRMIHPMSGCDTISCRGDWKTYVGNMCLCADAFSDHGLTVLLEVMSLPTVEGYFLHSFELFTALKNELPHENISLLFDTWHAKLIYDDVMHALIKFYPQIRHIQVSDHPGRHEPGTGNINFHHLFQFLNEKNYSGFVGCEYKPIGTTLDGLKFMSEFQKEKV